VHPAVVAAMTNWYRSPTRLPTAPVDDADRLTAITHTKTDNSIITKAEYTLDKTGNRTAKTGSTNETYTYDAIYRLTQATTPKGYETYTYDANGNRTQGPGPHDTRYQHEAANQLVKGKQYSYTHDNNGNPITKTTNNTDKNWTYTWDPENRLIKAELTNKTDKRTITYKYDPFGRRTEKQTTITTNGNTKTTTTNYIYDNDNITVETTATTENGSTTNTTTNYTHGITTDEHLAMERDGQYYYYHTDGLGSTTAITDNSSNTVQSYSYTTFGIPRQTTDFKNIYTFTGREWDKETALHYYRARYYDPVEGRFISRDPIKFRGGDVNLYAYVANDPVNATDPSGLEQLDGLDLYEIEHRPISSLKLPLIYNFIDPPQNMTDQELVMQFLPIGSVTKVMRLGKIVVDAEKFHRLIKPQILEKSGKFCKIVGRNPDIKIVDDKIWLTGTGPFKGKTFKTQLNAADFLK
jgi:RHS repeat-associated protein